MEQSAANPLSSIVVEPGTPFPHDEVLNYIFNEDESSPPPRRSNQQPQVPMPKIPKVPEMLRNLKTNEGCFDPRVVSIGRYHHGKPHLQEVEKLKTKLAKRYSSDHPSGGYDLHKKVKEVASKAREFYDIEPSKRYNDDEAFTKMMFLDGCFILEFMCSLVEEEYQALGMKNNVIANVKRDLFLLENQLPYIVLETLMVKKKFKSAEEWNMRIDTFISICRRHPPAVKPWWLAATKYFHRSSPEDDKPPLHLLDMTRTRFVIPSASTKAILPSATSEWYSYHSAKVLESKGIRFRPNKTGSFSDVKFKSLVRGVLTLPPIFIDASTKSVLLNLLAFESSHDDPADMQGVTSYVCFMDSLIDHAEDVMILRSKNVIINCLGNDQLVADLFNDIASNLVPNPRTYAEAKLGIQKHCNNKLKEWMAECYQAHCRNPWSLLALFGAIFAITLTVAQTYLAAVPPKK